MDRGEWSRTRQELARYRCVGIDCDLHRKAHHVIDFWSVDNDPWGEVRSASAGAKREAAVRDARLDPDDVMGYLCRGPQADRPEHVTRITGAVWPDEDEPAEWTGWRPPADGGPLDRPEPRLSALDSMLAQHGESDDGVRLVERSVYSIKCDRCDDGRDRRAEKLRPVLDLLHANGQRRVTVTAFWAVADEWDRQQRVTGLTTE